MELSNPNKTSGGKPITQVNMARINTIDDLPTVESHFYWLPKSDLTTERQEAALEKIVQWMADIEDVEVTPLTIISQHFCKFVFECLTHKFDDAMLTLEGLKEQLDFLKNDFTSEYNAIFNYMLVIEVANFWYLNDNNENAQKFVDKAKEMYSDILSSDICKAALLAMKALFVGHIGRTLDRVELFRAATNLDSTSSDLYQYLFSSLRRHRRESDWGAAPTDEEISACHKGYNLLECKTSSALSRMALLYEELVLATTKRGEIFRNSSTRIKEMTPKEMKEMLLFYIKQAAELNPNSIGMNVKYGDILSHGITENFTECEKQYTYCLDRWPNHSIVLHKVGKFYCLQKRELGKGLELLRKGLEANKDNFPCLMDYARFSSKINPWSTIIETLDEFTNYFAYKPVYQSRLLLMKGSILWSIEKKLIEAIQCWLKAQDIYPIGSNKLLDEISSAGVFRFQVDYSNVLKELETFASNLQKTNGHSSNPSSGNGIDKLLKTFKTEWGKNSRYRRPMPEAQRSADPDRDRNWRREKSSSVSDTTRKFESMNLRGTGAKHSGNNQPAAVSDTNNNFGVRKADTNTGRTRTDKVFSQASQDKYNYSKGPSNSLYNNQSTNRWRSDRSNESNEPSNWRGEKPNVSMSYGNNNKSASGKAANWTAPSCPGPSGFNKTLGNMPPKDPDRGIGKWSEHDWR